MITMYDNLLTYSRHTLLICLLALFPLVSYAGPAIPGMFPLVQPDGTTFYARLVGDEYMSVLMDDSGHAVAQNDNGYYCYAFYDNEGNRHCSDVIVGAMTSARAMMTRQTINEVEAAIAKSAIIPFDILKAKGQQRRSEVSAIRMSKAHGPDRLAAAGLRTDNSQQLPSKRSCIILLVEFSDVKMTYLRHNFVSMINDKGYSYNGATGSVSDYFAEQFRGSMDFEFEVGPLVTLSGKLKDYGAHVGTENDKNPAGLVAEACKKAAEAGVDFSKFDNDGDGEVDNVFVFVAGKDEAEGGGEDCIWSHQWYVYNGAGISLFLGGKRINNYAISTELGRNSNGTFTFTTIGTFCHEYTHVLGQMDMYDTDYEGSGGESNCLWGTTSLMDHGNYNNYGKTPPNFNAIDLDMLGCGQPETLVPGTYTLEPVEQNGRYLRYDTPNQGEYFLIECRSNNRWDKYIGGAGLCVYHIDKSSNDAGYSDANSRNITARQRWYSNEINCRPDYQCADMIEALTSAGTAAQAFFPYRDINALTPETSPAFVFKDGTPSPLALTNITRIGDQVKFTVTYVKDIEVPKVVNVKSQVYQTEAIISWESDVADYTGKAYVSWGQSDASLQEVVVDSWEDNKFGIRLEGLEPRKAYKVRIQFGVGGIYSSEVHADFTTKSRYDGYPYIRLDSDGRNADGTFVKGAKLPLVVYNKKEGDTVEWYFSGKAIIPDNSGFYRLSRGGNLRAVITSPGGKKEIIEKMIVVD